MGKAAAKRPAAKGRARAKGKRRPSGEPKCPNCRRGCWVGGCWEVAAGGCCWSVSLPALSGRRTSRNCVRKGAVRCHALYVPVPSFPCPCRLVALWAEAEGVKWQRQGPETLDPMPGVPQEEVAGGGVGLGRLPSGSLSRFVDSQQPSGRKHQEPVVHPKGRPDPRGAPALRDRAATGGRDWMGWDVGSCGR